MREVLGLWERRREEMAGGGGWGRGQGQESWQLVGKILHYLR